MNCGYLFLTKINKDSMHKDTTKRGSDRQLMTLMNKKADAISETMELPGEK